MGLLKNEIEIPLKGRNIIYFENLGYKIPRVHDKYYRKVVPNNATLLIKLKDLPTHSKIKVDVECDNCGKLLNMAYEKYYKYNHDGKYYCNHCANKVFHSGKKNWNYNSNITDKERKIKRNNLEYVDFVKRVIERDNHTCQYCGKECNHDAEVHHLDGYDWCIEKRTDDTNGITLCKTCHKNFHSLYGYGGNTKGQFEEWIGYAIGELKKYNGKLPTTRKIYCLEENKIYDSAEQLCECLGLKKGSSSNVYNICNHKKDSTNTVNGMHILWLNEYEKMNEKDIVEYLRKCKNKRYKSVICITTGDIYDSISEAGRKNNFSIFSIGECCRGKYKSSGKLLDGTRLQWMYYEDFLKLPTEKQNEILTRNKEFQL